MSDEETAISFAKDIFIVRVSMSLLFAVEISRDLMLPIVYFRLGPFIPANVECNVLNLLTSQLQRYVSSYVPFWFKIVSSDGIAGL